VAKRKIPSPWRDSNSDRHDRPPRGQSLYKFYLHVSRR
jgi:hypothetical protein